MKLFLPNFEKGGGEQKRDGAGEGEQEVERAFFS